MRPLICSLTVFLLTLSNSQALDLTPQQGARQGNEGPATQVMIFTDGAARYGYVPPAGWKSSGGGKVLSFFANDAGSWMRLMVIEKKNPQTPAGAETAKTDLQGWAAKFLPPDAEKAEFVKTSPSPFPMGTRSSTEYIYNYTISGIRNLLSVSVVEFSEKERLVMLVSADAKSFDQVRRQAVSSMFSWAAEE